MNRVNASGPLTDNPSAVIPGTPISWRRPQPLDVLCAFIAKRHNTLFVILLAAAALWCWHSLVDLYALTQQQEHYSHIVLIPFISLFAFYLNREAILSSQDSSPVSGLGLLGGSGVIAWQPFAGGAAVGELSVHILAFVGMCWGAFLLCYGIKAARTFAFGLLFLLWIVPFPPALLNAVIVFLQQKSAEATDVIFTLLGVPFYRDGYIFTLPNISIHVAEECSGIRSALSLVISSLVAGHFFLRSWWTKLSVLVLVIPLAIIKNAFRIVGLSLLANYVDRTFITDSLLHKAGGIPLFALSLAILLLVTWAFRRLEKASGYPSNALHGNV
jgi:exosortase